MATETQSNLLSADTLFKLIGSWQVNEQAKRQHELGIATAKQLTGDVVPVQQNVQGDKSSQAPSARAWYQHPMVQVAGAGLALLGVVALVNSLK